MEPNSNKPVAKKHWYESGNTHTLRQYAKSYGAEYVQATFKNWSYVGEHVKQLDPHGWGVYYVNIRSNGNSNGSSDSEILEIKYQFRPRRKLEFVMVPKRSFLGLLHRDLREVTMPDSVMSKLFKAIATHPSLLRATLKHEGLSGEMYTYLKASVRLKVKGHKATLSWTEPYKKPDTAVIQERMHMMNQYVLALHEQNVIHEG